MTPQEQQTQIYIPPNCRPLSDDLSKQQIRLGIQGFGGAGKTWSILGSPNGKQKGFPNPIVLNLDRGIGAHQGNPNIIEIPFWRIDFGGKPEEKKDRLTEWLNKEGPKICSSQTLVLDSLSKLDQIYHSWFKANEAAISISKKGKYNDFAEYQEKNKWFCELHNIFGGFKCDIVLLAHEAERPDKSTTIGIPGTYTGKIHPILSGQFGDTIIKEYTDWFRQHCQQKTKEPKDITLESFRMTKDQFLYMQDSFEGQAVYFWQTIGDDLFNAKASSLVNPPTFIPATYESFLKYSRSTNKTTN